MTSVDPPKTSKLHSCKLTQLAGKWTRIEDVCAIENGDIPLLCQFNKGYCNLLGVFLCLFWGCVNFCILVGCILNAKKRMQTWEDGKRDPPTVQNGKTSTCQKKSTPLKDLIFAAKYPGLKQKHQQTKKVIQVTAPNPRRQGTSPTFQWNLVGALDPTSQPAGFPNASNES